MKPSIVARGAAVGMSVAMGLLLATSCGEPDEAASAAREPREHFRVTLIGIDGATFDVLDPLLEQGELRGGLARLIEQGTRAPLRSEPPLLSPPIWTTIATGVSRKLHGIERFEVRGGELVSSRQRRAPAIWNLASRAGLRSAVVGWWGTYPAEAIDGVIISERALKLRERDLRSRFGEHLASSRFDQLAHPTSALSLLPKETRAAADGGGGEADPNALQLRAAEEDRITVRTLEAVDRELGPFDLSLVLLRGVDPVSHVFWRYREPDAAAYRELRETSPAPPVPGLEAPERVIDDHYIRVDELIDALVVPSADHVVIAVSDHGFEARDEGAPLGVAITGHHRSRAALDGIFLAAGGPLRRGARLEPGSIGIYDLAPLLLHLLGMPVPVAMPGEVPAELFEPGWLAEHPVERSAEPTGAPHDVPASSESVPSPTPEVDERLREELRALGYIE